jgi:ComF family protein
MAFQNLIHELKYKKQFLIGNYLGRLINSELNEYIKSWEADLIIPVPLHQLKKAERGFNQSFYIAKSLSKETGIPVKHKLLKRVKYTQSQTKLNMEGRKANIEGVFKVKNPKEVKNKNIILLDDVITTGSTMNECAKTLQSKGAGEIFALSVALAGS